VRLEVEDDGAGFDPASVLDSRIGIKIMSERLHQLDGSVRFARRRAGGTVLVAEAPVRRIDLVGLTAEMGRA
jgi:signal transduction histidine kinase